MPKAVRHSAMLASALIAALGLTGETVAAQAQDSVIHVRGGPTCARCRIVLRTIATISDDQFPIDEFATRIFRTSAGLYLISGERSTAVGVFAPDGRFMRRLGRRGEGAGEFRQINWIAEGESGTLLVFDHQLRRVTSFDPRTFRVESTTRFPAVNESLTIGPDRMLVSGLIQSARTGSRPLHVIARDGVVQRSFGSSGAASADALERSMYRLLARGVGRSTLTAPLSEYRIERWGPELEPRPAVVRHVPWFPATATLRAVGDPSRERPPPILRGIWEDSTRLLWANIGVASARWAPAPTPRSGERPLILNAELDALYETIVEVLDPRAGSVVASQRFDQILGTIAGSSFHWMVSEDSTGASSIRIVRVELVRP